MPFNGSGVFQRPYSWITDAAAGLNVDATRMDADSNDIATGLSNCITRDGQSPPTANIPMGNYKLTGLAAGTTTGDAVNYEQLQGVANEVLVSLSAGVNTLTASSITKLHVAQPGTTVTTVNLPLLSTVVAGNKIKFVNLSSASFVVTRQGSDAVIGISGSGTLTSVTVRSGQTLEMVSQGSAWSPVDGSAAMSSGNATGPFGFSASSNGYCWINRGILVQWLIGSAGAPGSYVDNNYPIPFPNNFFSASATHYGGAEAANVVINNNSPNEKTAIRLESSNATGSTVYIIAIGN